LAPCVFAQEELNRLALDIVAHRALAPFADLCAAIGPDIAQVKKAFASVPRATRYPLVLGHQGEMATIDLAPSKLAGGVPRGAGAAALHRRGAAALLVAERPHLGSEALVAMLAPRPVLATAFWEIRLHHPEAAAPLLLWLNSTYGVLAFLAAATSSRGDIVKMKKAQLAEMRAPEPASVDAAACERLLARVRGVAFLSYGAEFARAALGDGPRLALDRFFGAALALPAISPDLYLRLARDPVVCRKRLALTPPTSACR
jgi:hypothetical protein